MMNTVRKSENLLPFPVISAAANGDTTAMCAILKHYEGYIAKLCTRTLKDDAGNTYSYVDEEMRNRLQVRLITRTLALILLYGDCTSTFMVGSTVALAGIFLTGFPTFPDVLCINKLCFI